MLTLSMHPILIGVLVVCFVLISVLVILTILIQKPQGGGLSGAFGSGAGSGQTAFGAKTGDALTIATIGMFVVWVIFAVGLNFAVRPTEANMGGAVVAPVPGTGGEEGTGDQPASGGTETPAPASGNPPATTNPPATGTPAGSTPPAPAPAPGEKPAEPQPAPPPPPGG